MIKWTLCPADCVCVSCSHLIAHSQSTFNRAANKLTTFFKIQFWQTRFLVGHQLVRWELVRWFAGSLLNRSAYSIGFDGEPCLIKSTGQNAMQPWTKQTDLNGQLKLVLVCCCCSVFRFFCIIVLVPFFCLFVRIDILTQITLSNNKQTNMLKLSLPFFFTSVLIEQHQRKWIQITSSSSCLLDEWPESEFIFPFNPRNVSPSLDCFSFVLMCNDKCSTK